MTNKSMLLLLVLAFVNACLGGLGLYALIVTFGVPTTAILMGIGVIASVVTFEMGQQ